jgi:hypothetical protein
MQTSVRAAGKPPFARVTWGAFFALALWSLIASVSAALLLRPLPARQPPPSNRPSATPRAAQTAPQKAPASAPIALSRPSEIANYDFDVDLDSHTHVLRGRGTMQLVNTTRHPLDHVWLHLYLNAFQSPQTIFGREHALEFRGNRHSSAPGHIEVQSLRASGVDLWASHDYPDANDTTDVRLSLKTQVQPGATLDIEVAFTAELPQIILRTGYADDFHMVAQWFPKFAKLQEDGSFAHFPFHRLAEFYADFGHYRVRIHADSAQIIGATGSCTAPIFERGRATQVCEAHDVHDFAFAAWDKFKVLERTVGDIQVRVLYPLYYEGEAERELGAVEDALPRLEERYGKYPYTTLTIVHPPEGDAAEAGGMEYPTLITTGGAAHTLAADHSVEALTLHELSHQYFYGILASNEARWPFLDEGLTAYSEALLLRERYGDAGSIELGGLRVSANVIYAASASMTTADLPAASAARDFESGAAYTGLVYGHTATVLESLRRSAPPGALDTALLDYATTQRFLHPQPAALFAAIERHLGATAADDVQAALETSATLADSISAFTSREAPAGAALRYQCSATISRTGELKLPTEYAFYTDIGPLPAAVVVPTAAGTLVQTQSARHCSGIVLDPALKLLLAKERQWSMARNFRTLPLRALGAGHAVAATLGAMP